MAYSEELAERVRADLRGRVTVDERRMFGGLAYMLDGHMFAGVLGDQLIVRLGAERGARALERPHTAPMDFTGRPLKAFVYVASVGLESAGELRRWLDEAIEFVRSLPPK
jgi:TfoX/Sxy family transcriptional regulator of competence genes